MRPAAAFPPGACCRTPVASMLNRHRSCPERLCATSTAWGRPGLSAFAATPVTGDRRLRWFVAPSIPTGGSRPSSATACPRPLESSRPSCRPDRQLFRGRRQAFGRQADRTIPGDLATTAVAVVVSTLERNGAEKAERCEGPITLKVRPVRNRDELPRSRDSRFWLCTTLWNYLEQQPKQCRTRKRKFSKLLIP